MVISHQSGHGGVSAVQYKYSRSSFNRRVGHSITSVVTADFLHIKINLIFTTNVKDT